MLVQSSEICFNTNQILTVLQISTTDLLKFEIFIFHCIFYFNLIFNNFRYLYYVWYLYFEGSFFIFLLYLLL